LHTLPHCNCSQYPWSTGWWLPPQIWISTVTFCFNLKANKELENLLNSATQNAQNGIYSVKEEMMEWLWIVGGNRMAKIKVFLGICCQELRKPIPNLYSG
jgi:hypothetical protein